MRRGEGRGEREGGEGREERGGRRREGRVIINNNYWYNNYC